MNRSGNEPAAFDEYGFLVDPDQWNRDLARELARKLGVGELEEDHWRIIDRIRQHYMKSRSLLWMEHTCRELGMERHCVKRLFKGPTEAWKIAGLPNPGEEVRNYMLNEE